MAQKAKNKISAPFPDNQFEMLYKTMPLGVVYQDKNGKIISSNPAAEQILGLSKDEMLGRTSVNPEWKCIHEDGTDFPGETHPSMIALQSGKTVSNTIMGVYHPREKKHHWLLVNAIPLFKPGESKPYQVYTTFNDITKHIENEKALHKSESFLKNILDQSPNPICITDEKGTLIRINNALLNMMNLSEEEVIGKYNVFKDNIVKEQGHIPLVKRVFEKGEIINFELTYDTSLLKHLSLKKTAFAILDVTIFPIKDNNGRITNAVVQQSDITERKKAIESLQQSEDRYKRLVESVTDYIYSFKIINGKPAYKSHSPGCQTITGYTPEELNNNPDLWEEMVYPDDLPLVIEYANNLLNNEVAAPVEHRIIHKDGSIRWVRNSTVISRDPGKNLIAFDSLISDITKRKNAELDLQSSKEFAENLISTANTMVIGLDINGSITIFNKAAEEITGYTQDELKTQSWFETLVPQNRYPEVWEEFGRLTTGGLPIRFENPILTKSGEERYIVWRNNTITKHGEVTGTISFGIDITERKIAEEALQISEKKYRNIFERAVEGIFQCTPQGKFLSVNPSFAKMLGYATPKDLITEITSIKKQLFVDINEFKQFINTLTLSGSIDGFEHQFYKKDETKIWMSTNAHIVRNSKGEEMYYEGISENITIRKKAEEEKEKLQLQLHQAQKMEALGTFVGGIAHDFNNILSIMMGYADLLQMEINKDDPLSVYVEQIISSAGKAANLTQSLLAFSRKKAITLKSLNINNHIQKTEKLLKRLLTEDIILKINLTEDDSTIMGDATQIDQILFNLATNARDAMTNGGALTIETKIIELNYDYVSTLGFGKPGKYVLLSVSDTGTGIDDETKQYVFDPFFTTKEVGKGTGLGLSTVYGIAKQHNGHINLYSEPGIGTTFHVYLPVSGQNMKKATTDSGKEIKGGKEKLLIAEDNNQVRLLIKTILEKYGYHIIEAVDGHDAVQKFKMNNDVDLIVIDSVMPNKNGREVYDEIKKTHPDIKVLFTSGYTRDVILDKGIEDREFDFITKPIVAQALLIKVREILDRK